MRLHKQLKLWWDRTAVYTGAAASRYQSINHLTQHMNEWNEVWPQHRELLLRIACGFIYIPWIVWTIKGCETGATKV